MFILIISDCKQAREARTAPHRRTPPLQLLRLKRAIGATLEARAKAADRAAILPGDTHVLFDGGKDGNHWKTKAAFVRDQGNALKPKVTRTLQLVFSEDRVAERRGYSTRGGGKPPTERAVLACHAGQARHADEEAQTLHRHEPRGRAGGRAGAGR